LVSHFFAGFLADLAPTPAKAVIGINRLRATTTAGRNRLESGLPEVEATDWLILFIVQTMQQSALLRKRKPDWNTGAC